MPSSSARPQKKRQTRLSFAQPFSSPTARLPIQREASQHPSSSPTRKPLQTGTLDKWRKSIMETQREARSGQKRSERNGSRRQADEMKINQDDDDEVIKGPPLDLAESSEESSESSRMNGRKRKRRAGSSSSPEPTAKKKSKQSTDPATEKKTNGMSNQKEHRSPFGTIKSNGRAKALTDSDDSDEADSPFDELHEPDAYSYLPSLEKPRIATASPKRPSRSINFLSGGSSGAAPISHSQRSSKLVSTPSQNTVNATPKEAERSGLTPSRPSARRLVVSSDEEDEEDEEINEERGSYSGELSKSDIPMEESSKRESEGTNSSAESSEEDVQVVENEIKQESESDASDAPPSSGMKRASRRRLLHRPKRQVASEVEDEVHSDQEAEDIKEDLEDLQENRVQKSRTRGRAQRSSKKSKLQENLERLKRRRAGGRSVSPADGTDLDSQSESTSENISLPEDLDDEEESEPHVSATKRSRKRGKEDLDTYEEDFVVDDADDLIGAPVDDGSGLYDMPIEFTRHAHKSLKKHFKDAVEWMVHNRINPAFPRNDGIYELAFRRLNNEVQGLSLSKFTSSSWTQTFIRALNARPHMIQLELERERRANMFETMKCDACNRRHYVTWQMQFRGKPYDIDTLEDVSDEEDSDVDDDGAEGTRDIQGRKIPRADHWFFLGRFCKANAESAHTLTHWRYHLNEWVVDQLEQKGYMDPQMIVQRAKWSNNKRRDHANEIVDAMESEGEIHSLWRDFKANLEAAREAKTDPYGK